MSPSSPAPPPSRDAESPSTSPTFSHANTLNGPETRVDILVGTPRTQMSSYSANTGGRARQSWRHGQIFEAAGIPLSPEQRTSYDTDRVSPTTRNAPSQTDSSPADSIVSRMALPRLNVPQSQTFLDAPSSSSSEDQSPASRAFVDRASSVRVHKARVVENHGSQKSTHVEHQDSATQLPIDNASSGLRIHTAGESNMPENDATPTTNPPPTPTQSLLRAVVDLPDTPIRAEVLDTLPSPSAGFGSVSLWARYPRKPQLASPPQAAPATGPDGLRSNPVQSFESSRLHRAISAPPVPAVGKTPNKRVTIRPSDLSIANHAASHHQSFRESVVSTPYPGPLHDIELHASHDRAFEAATATARDRYAPPAANALPVPPPNQDTPLTDRFPSPARGSETLFLEISFGTAHTHHHAKAPVEVKLDDHDRGSFDDERLFQLIKRAYNRQLLSLTRRYLTARTLQRVELTTTTAANHGEGIADQDAADFLRHMRTPRLGRRRKNWLVWVRNAQHKEAHQVGTPESYASMQARFGQYNGEAGGDVPVVRFVHEFSVRRIAVVVGLVALVSCLATVLWVLFGLPGESVGKGGAVKMGPLLEGEVVERGWRVDSGGRVLTGLVMGILVFLLGSMGGVVWVVGSLTLLP